MRCVPFFFLFYRLDILTAGKQDTSSKQSILFAGPFNSDWFNNYLSIPHWESLSANSYLIHANWSRQVKLLTNMAVGAGSTGAGRGAWGGGTAQLADFPTMTNNWDGPSYLSFIVWTMVKISCSAQLSFISRLVSHKFDCSNIRYKTWDFYGTVLNNILITKTKTMRINSTTIYLRLGILLKCSIHPSIFWGQVAVPAGLARHSGHPSCQKHFPSSS